MENHKNAPLVSMVCDTYQQAAFIGKTLDGFLMQQTDFPVEIVVHDDASTDGTADIVRDYARRYPDTIRGIYRKENMYSKDPKILEHYVFPHCKGKYTAICEGDDYWIDPLKLQKQIDWMESHPDCTLCFTAAELVDGNGTHIGWQRPFEGEQDVPTETIIRGMGAFCPTASIVVPTRLAQNRAPFCDLTTVDDAPLQIFFASRGTTHYLPDATCAYRVEAPGSWTVAQKSASVQKKVAIQKSLIAMHRAFDEDTGGRWHDAVEDALRNDNFEIYWLTEDRKAMREQAYLALYRKLPLRSRGRLLLKQYAPWLHGLLKGKG